MVAPTAIQTVYQGYKFRSRLEARWAVFFDSLGIRYEYEKEGFDLPEVGRYLPDFWLPDYEAWVEVKPDKPTEDEMRKCFALSKLGDNKWRVVLLAGNPWFREYWIHYVSPVWHDREPCWYFEDGQFATCFSCGRLWLNEADTAWVRFGKHPDCIWADARPQNIYGEVIELIPAFHSDELQSAFIAARQARFEFGERG